MQQLYHDEDLLQDFAVEDVLRDWTASFKGWLASQCAADKPLIRGNAQKMHVW